MSPTQKNYFSLPSNMASNVSDAFIYFSVSDSNKKEG